MKRTLAITAASAMLALSLAGCGARDGTDAELLPDTDGANGVTATDTMRNERGNYGTGMNAGASTNGTANGTANGTTNGRYGTTANGYGAANGTAANGGLGSVTGAVNRGYTAANDVYDGSLRSGAAARAGGRVDYSDDAAVRRAAQSGDNYARMLENGRVHDTDGFLLDGENAHWNTF